MNRTRRNIVANYAGTFGSALLSIVFVPLYLRYLGVEAYGLLGVFTALNAIFAPLDAGLSTVLSRSLAALNVDDTRKQEMRSLVRSLEVVYWASAAFIGVAIISLAPLIATRWIRPAALPPAVLTEAIVMMGFAAALRWPMMLYSGGINGLQLQTKSNAILLVASAVAGIGAIAVLHFVEASITAFMTWQVAVFGGQTFAAALVLRRHLPAGPARFDGAVVRASLRSAGGISAISIMAVVITQTDKVVLSRLLSLQEFGYYTIASVVAANLYRLCVPASAAMFPRFTELITLRDEAALRALYHRGAQLISVLVYPIAIMIATFPYETLLLWTQQPGLARQTSLTLSLLVIGTTLHTMMHLPYYLQLAASWTGLTLAVATLNAAILLPGIWYLGSRFGGPGAAVMWILSNVVNVFIGVQWMHRRLLVGEKLRWYAIDIGLPLAASVTGALLARIVIPGDLPQPVLVAALGAATLIAFIGTAMATPTTRQMVLSRLRRAPA